MTMTMGYRLIAAALAALVFLACAPHSLAEPDVPVAVPLNLSGQRAEDGRALLCRAGTPRECAAFPTRCVDRGEEVAAEERWVCVSYFASELAPEPVVCAEACGPKGAREQSATGECRCAEEGE